MVKDIKKQMKIAIVHHHLNPGGVTQVIQSQIRSLLAFDVEIDLVVGARPIDHHPVYEQVNLTVEPKLNYLYPHEADFERSESLLRFYSDFLAETFRNSDILHIHNLNLGKNPVLTYAFYQMLLKGWKIFHHCHDFAEDRPDNYAYLQQIISNFFCDSLPDVMYPDYPNYHIATINRIDQARLPKSIASERSFYLPNPIEPPRFAIENKSQSKKKVCNDLGLDPSKLLITYPVRVIERKNIGECILWAKLFAGIANFVVTQPPKNPGQILQYEKWKSFCQRNNIPFVFEAGTKTNFYALLNGSDFCISTSNREGFGMAFLEPWLFSTPVIGRNLRAVTSDFIDEGMELERLYDFLMVDGRDFMKYKPSEQMELIKGATFESVSTENYYVSSFLEKIETATIEHNATIIKDEYSLENYGKRLYGVYSKMLGNP